MNALEQINNLVASEKTSGRTPQAQAEAIRKAAQQFEAVLLTQLTSALNNTGSGDEDSLFGNDGGSDLAKQMFSEQLATTMANSGGIGLSDVIMRQFGISESALTGKAKTLNGAWQAIKDIRGNKPQSAAENNASLINTSAKSTYKPEVFTGNADEAQIISTIEDQAANGDVDESVKNLMLNGQYLSSTRPRIVPEYAVVAGEKPILTNNLASNSAPSVSNASAVNFQMPVNGRVSSNFGTRFHPVDRKTKFHGGMDIAVPTGTPIGAAANGEVAFAGWKGGYGNLIIIRHPDGRETRYGHLEKINVTAGDTVFAGQNIAASGSTGKSTGPHLHFEIRENGKAVDPRKVLAKVLPKDADK